MVIPTLSTGGAEKFVRDTALQVNRELFDLSVIVLFPRSGSQKERDLEEAGIPLYFLNKKTGLSLKCARDLKKLIKRLRPDVIHSHLDVLLYLLPSYKRSQVKLHTVHSMAAFEAAGVNKWIRKIAFKLFGVTPVAIGETVRESIADYYNISPQKIPCIYNGIPMPTVCRQEQGETFSFITVGTLYYVKNHEMLLRAFKACVQRTQKKVSLCIVGDGDLRATLEQQIEELGLAQHVRMTGWMDHVARELCRADAYVCSSIIEGISLSIIEAMACGLPIVATDVGGNKDLVKHEVNGLLVENRNEEALTTAMLKMVEDEEFHRQCAHASQTMAQKYTVEACVQEYEELYRS